MLKLARLSVWLEDAPAWVTSGLLHAAFLMLLAILAFTSASDPPFELNVGIAPDLGEQMLVESLDLMNATEIELPEQTLTPELLPEVDDPLATPPLATLVPNSAALSSEVPSVTIGMALSGRTEGSKQALMKQMGATAKTEEAVMAGLRWLAKQQRNDGGWSLKGPFSDGAFTENRQAATAMALLAFQGAGKLPTSSRNDFGPVVAKGWRWMLKTQQRDGSFFQRGGSNHRFYTHAQVTIALCELYALTGEERYREPAEQAVLYLLETQAEQGGWKYNPKVRSDLSVTGWVLMALKSARMAGLEVPTPVFHRIEDYLEQVSRADPPVYGARGSRYVYEVADVFNREAIPTMTSVGLLCRQYMGWRMSERRLANGVEFLLEHPPEWRVGKIDVYYWYYASQTLLHAGGPFWEKWNRLLREMLPDNQVKRGPEKGSWFSNDDPWSTSGGRLYITCMAIYTLEVYYRHLPLYMQKATE